MILACLRADPHGVNVHAERDVRCIRVERRVAGLAGARVADFIAFLAHCPFPLGPLNGTGAALARQLRADVASWRVWLANGVPTQRTGRVGLLNEAAELRLLQLDVHLPLKQHVNSTQFTPS